ncbi:cytochrome c oxidase assembly protein COX11, mitochondrial [Biomphalaria glabrata]|nr:cytochrome c oxidase assembly protein COX11, mitochondrial [Biomphalaria glabrata]
MSKLELKNTIVGSTDWTVKIKKSRRWNEKSGSDFPSESFLTETFYVDMPVFFYIDPEFAEDPKLEHVESIMLSYTFFEAKEGLALPLPGYHQPHMTAAPATVATP